MMLIKNTKRLYLIYKAIKYVLGAIVIDVLGFRSFARKIVDKYLK